MLVRPAVMAEVSGRVELRVPLDATDIPVAYLDRDGLLGVEMAGPGAQVTLTLALSGAREWAAELFAAISVAYREATGDPHALDDVTVAGLADPAAYRPEPGIHVSADRHGPAGIRFSLTVDIEGVRLSSPRLRADLVGTLAESFNTTRIAVSDGVPIAGTVT